MSASSNSKQDGNIYKHTNIAFVRVLHKFLMKITELDSHKFLILIKVSLVALVALEC